MLAAFFNFNVAFVVISIGMLTAKLVMQDNDDSAVVELQSTTVRSVAMLPALLICLDFIFILENIISK